MMMAGKIVGEVMPAGAEHARQERESVFLSCTLQFRDSGMEEVCRVRNISPGGLQIDCLSTAERGDAVSVTLRGIGTVDAVIAWSRKGRAGLRLATEVDPKQCRKSVLGKPHADELGRKPYRVGW